MSRNDASVIHSQCYGCAVIGCFLQSIPDPNLSSLSSLSGKTTTGKRINVKNALQNIPLFTPFNLGVVTTSSTAEITFKDNTFTETNIHVVRKIGRYGIWSQIASLPPYSGANINKWTDRGLSLGKLYCYKLRAYNGVGYSPYSNEICKITKKGLIDSY